MRENAGRLSPEEMAKQLGKTVSAVKQFMHRKRIVTGERVARNLVKEILVKRFVNPDYFKPTREFYDAVGVNQKRWWDVYYGREPVTDEEYMRLSGHFGVELEKAIGKEQLSLFNDGDICGGN